MLGIAVAVRVGFDDDGRNDSTQKCSPQILESTVGFQSSVSGFPTNITQSLRRDSVFNGNL